MVFDLDAIVNKKRTIRYAGRDVEIKDLTLSEYLLADYEGNAVDDIKSEGREAIKELSAQMIKYLMMVLDISEEEAQQMDYRQFRHLREYLSELDLLDQGFTPKEVETMKKRAAKKQMEQMIAADGNPQAL